MEPRRWPAYKASTSRQTSLYSSPGLWKLQKKLPLKSRLAFHTPEASFYLKTQPEKQFLGRTYPASPSWSCCLATLQLLRARSCAAASVLSRAACSAQQLGNQGWSNGIGTGWRGLQEGVWSEWSQGCFFRSAHCLWYIVLPEPYVSWLLKS